MFVPAGYELSESEDEYGFGHDESTNNSTKVDHHVDKSPMELKRERLLEHVKSNQLLSLNEELDSEPKGFDIDEPVDGHWNLLYHACHLALADIVQFLIEERGACVNMREKDETPLMVACYSSADLGEVFKVVKALIKKSTIISSSNLNGFTPLMYASRQGNIEVVKYLLSLNDAYDALDNERCNALFHAIECNHLDVAKLLIAAGTDLSVTNKNGLTAKEFARNEYHFDFFDLFPPEPYRYETPSDFLSYNRFEDLIPDLSRDV